MFRYPGILGSPAQRREQVSEADVHRAARLVAALADISKSTRLWKAIICSAVEHLNRAESDSIRRVDEAEAIARFFITRVLGTLQLLGVFKSDAEIHAFWRRREAERNVIWGQTLSLQDALAHLHYDRETPGR